MRTSPAFHIAVLFGRLLFAGGPVAAQTSDTVDRSELKVCADPSNLPYSDEKKEGFENKIAELMGGELGLKVDYAWFPQVIGFVRNTLRAHLCDLVMGTVAGDEIMQTTNPYYFTTYVMFYRSDKALTIDGTQDARLAGLHLGVVAGTPPADLLVRHELMPQGRRLLLPRQRVEPREFRGTDEAIAMAVMYTANHMDVQAIVALTESGSTPLWMSRIRSDIPIYAFTRHEATRRRVTLYRGVYPVSFDITHTDPAILYQSIFHILVELGLCALGDLIIVTKGERSGVSGGTNSMKILEVRP